MKFKLSTDFYEALALFSQAGCPFTQAGSLPLQAQSTCPQVASSAIVLGNTACRPTETLRSAPSTAGSDQRTLVPSLGTSIRTSSRPSTSSSSTWRFEPGLSTFSATAYDTGRGPAHPQKSLISPFFSDSHLTPKISTHAFHPHQNLNRAQHRVPIDPSFPSSSDPLAAVVGATVGDGHHTVGPSLGPLAPRPSTAPTFDTQTFSQMLPPKRELPFKVARTLGGSSKGQSEYNQELSYLRPRKADSIAARSIVSNPRVDHYTDHLPSEAPKRAPAKHATKATRVTRNTAATLRSRKKSAIPMDDKPVPSVEELLRRSETLAGVPAGIDYQDKDAKNFPGHLTTSNSNVPKNNVENAARPQVLAMSEGHAREPEERMGIYQDSDIDTQALLDHIDEHQRRQIGKCKDVANTRRESSPISPPKRVTSNMHPGTVRPLPNDDIHLPMVEFPEAATGHVDMAGSSVPATSSLPAATSVDAVYGHGSQEDEGIFLSAGMPVEDIPATSIGPETTKPAEPPALVNISNLAQPERSHTFATSSLMALMNDPNFAQSPEIAQWADLSPEERDAALETWMCEQLESENFATLMKSLEGMWQRIFFGR